MSKEALAKIVQRSISDAAFRRQLASDPTGALRGYDLTADEASAVRSGDSRRLTSLGVEQRMSKAFTLSNESTTGSLISPSVSSDLGASFTGAATTGGAGTMGGAVLAPGDGPNFGAALTSGDGSDSDPVIADTSGVERDAAVIPGDPAHALGAETPNEFGAASATLTPGDDALSGVIVVDEAGAGGGTTPGEALDGPSIQS